MVMVDNDQEDAAGSHGELTDKDSPVTTETAFVLYRPQVIILMLVPLFFQTASARCIHSRKPCHVLFTTPKASIIGKYARAQPFNTLIMFVMGM